MGAELLWSTGSAVDDEPGRIAGDDLEAGQCIAFDALMGYAVTTANVYLLDVDSRLFLFGPAERWTGAPRGFRKPVTDLFGEVSTFRRVMADLRDYLMSAGPVERSETDEWWLQTRSRRAIGSLDYLIDLPGTAERLTGLARVNAIHPDVDGHRLVAASLLRLERPDD